MKNKASAPVDAPSETDLTESLGPAKEHWDAILDFCRKPPQNLSADWKLYLGKIGWQMKVSDKKRAVAYLTPRQDSFIASFALNAAAVGRLGDSGLPQSFIRDVENGKTYPEGKMARAEVTNSADVATVKTLIAVKLDDPVNDI